MLIPLVPGALMATAALKVPGVCKPTGFTITCRLPGKLPAVGLTLSQVAPLLVIGLAVKFVTPELELDRETVCDVDDVLPGAKTKLSEFGFAEIGLDPPVEFAFSVTGIDKVVVPEATLTKPTSTPLVGAPVPIETVRTAGVLELEEVTINQPASE
jgi:hypothetical protein